MSIIVLDKLGLAPQIQAVLETIYDPELKPANIVIWDLSTKSLQRKRALQRS